MRDNLPVMIALFESTTTERPRSGRAWQRWPRTRTCSATTWSTCGSRVARFPATRPHRRGHGRHAVQLAYAVLTSEASGVSDDEVVDALTALLLDGLRGPGGRCRSQPAGGVDRA
ncbi:hypothetical protein ACIA98_16850 [Streptomyces sp. NPDC051366]|uniref:hypothetical protein n=1 Tax=Streptomyces sp. NPDC051366 TaxID=3365652 RepID=UPI0037A83B57